jgi:hypothetical protein
MLRLSPSANNPLKRKEVVASFLRGKAEGLTLSNKSSSVCVCEC